MALAKLLELRPDEDDFEPANTPPPPSQATSCSGRRPLSSKSSERNRTPKIRDLNISNRGFQQKNSHRCQKRRRLTYKAKISLSQLLKHRSDEDDFEQENVRFRYTQQRHPGAHSNQPQPSKEYNQTNRSLGKQKEGQPRLKLIQRLKKLSAHHENIQFLSDQWFLDYIEDLCRRRGHCPCGQKRLRYYYHIQNRRTERRMHVGSTCILYFRKRYEKTIPIAESDNNVESGFALGSDSQAGQRCEFVTPLAAPENSSTGGVNKIPHKDRGKKIILSKSKRSWIRLF
ncbi:uncharacterized protein LOC110989858 isoform X2 [Acanthaster planci]|nr:uncharacterized protein LOC110989858 isoform X2 [Acanthaster planci]XP_022110229.1 uncharacterized protein LOC110989858 isoform X2 [Acanthaster planci]XP_022110230.1 uncharacterized protein LOC110989858 isoform X2 [Acanthaster planci]